MKRGQIPVDQIGHAIEKIGKPFDQAKILAAKDTVAPYLDHNDSWVRHEAMWFLTSWGRLKEYQPALIRALQSDPDLDNRSFAAACLGKLCQGTNEAEAVAALKTTVEDSDLEQLLRLYAYRALLQVVKGISDLEYSPHERQLSEVDWKWVSSL
ncbi:MAG TPA: HEAT repeat domain-containing protein [Terriglobales bacterium]|nr:HEAT repeat domain-containing protein [Terriglobales bacterium]